MIIITNKYKIQNISISFHIILVYTIHNLKNKDFVGKLAEFKPVHIILFTNLTLVNWKIECGVDRVFEKLIYYLVFTLTLAYYIFNIYSKWLTFLNILLDIIKISTYYVLFLKNKIHQFNLIYYIFNLHGVL